MVTAFCPSSSFLHSPSQFLHQSQVTSPNSVTLRPSRISASCTSTARPPAMSSSPSSLYEVLGVQMGVTSQEIKTAYRKLARVCHPDVVSVNRNNTSGDEFMKIHAAYLTLSDPNKRANYDRSLFKKPRPFATSASPSMASAMSGFSGYTTRRGWETDQCW